MNRPLPWKRVVRATTPTEVLESIAPRFGCRLRCLETEPPTGSAGEHARAGRWIVEASGDASSDSLRESAAAAAEVLVAWEASRDEVRRAGLRAAEYGADVEALQALGQRLASARDVAELVAAAADTLHARVGLDGCGIVDRLRPTTSARFAVFRPGMQGILEEVARRARALVAPDGGEAMRIFATPGAAFDPTLPPRGRLAEEDVLLVRVPVRAAAGAVLAVVPTAEPDERARRIAQGVSGLLALHVDRMAALAREEDLRFRAIVDGMPQAVWLVDRDLRVVRSNRAAEALSADLGWAPLDPVGSLGSFDAAAAVAEVLREGTSGTEGDVSVPGGRMFSVTVTPVRDDSGRAAAAVVVAADVTEARRLQSRIAQSERLSSLGRMLSGVAHELNNPLATVIGFAEIARSAPSDAGLEKRLRLIHDEALRCQRIVGTLLRFARRQERERKPVILNELVETTLGLLAYPLRVDGIRVETDLDRSLPAIHADPHELQQVLVNLVTNAHQAIRSARRPGVVSVRTVRRGDRDVLLEVRDDGPGVPEAIRDRIFDPFFTTKPPEEGTGLGLSLVYGTVRSHGGSVEVDSVPGGGASFLITLPVGLPVPDSKVADRAEAFREPLHGARVLVVDDEPGVSLLICEALSREGCLTTAANEAEDVRRLVRDEPFDAVVCDLRMPGLESERLHELLGRERPGLERGIVLTTGDTVSLEPERVAVSTGATVVHKPFDLHALRDAVRLALGRRRAP